MPTRTIPVTVASRPARLHDQGHLRPEELLLHAPFHRHRLRRRCRQATPGPCRVARCHDGDEPRRGTGPAAAHLAEGVAATPDVPFLAHPRRAAEITASLPYAELAQYCRVHHDEIEQVFRTVSYVDVVNHAKRTAVPALFSRRPARRHHAGVDRVRGVQPLRRAEGDSRLSLQRPRGWRNDPHAKKARVSFAASLRR